MTDLKHRGPVGTPRTVELWAGRAWRSVPDGVDAHCQLTAEVLGGAEVVATWPLESLAKTPGEWAVEVFEIASGDAESRGARTTYQLRVLSVIEGLPFASRNLRVDPALPSSGAAPGVENASMAGLVGQLMRHNEGLVKQMVVMAERSSKAMSDAMLALAERTAELERENMKLARKLREQDANEGEQAAIVMAEERKGKREEVLLDFFQKQAAKQHLKELAEINGKGKKPALKPTNGASNGAKKEG